MEVHRGKCRSENFEWWLCEANFEEYEVYECDENYKRDTNLRATKKHIQSIHKSPTRILIFKNGQKLFKLGESRYI